MYASISLILKLSSESSFIAAYILKVYLGLKVVHVTYLTFYIIFNKIDMMRLSQNSLFRIGTMLYSNWVYILHLRNRTLMCPS